MLSYKNWKSLNESIFNRSLGLSSPQSLGLISPIHSEGKAKKEVIEDESGDGETVPAASEKDEPKMVKCKHCGKYSKMMKKEEMEHEEEESEEEDHKEEDHEDEGESEEEDHEEEDESEEDEDESEEEDHDEEDEEESEEEDMEESKKHKKGKKHMKHMKCMKCMHEAVSHKKKKSKKGKKHMKHMKCMKCMKADDVEVRDINKNGKIEGWEKARAKAIKKSLKEKNESVDENAWMKDVFGSNPQQKFYDGMN